MQGLAGAKLAARAFLLRTLCLVSLAWSVHATEVRVEHEFYFTRGMYSDEFSFGDDPGGSWSIDYPKADRQFLNALDRLSILDASIKEHAIRLTDPNLGDQPFLYAPEVGSMQLTDEEAVALGDYLLAGGFLFIDDFWGSWAWTNLVEQMQRVLPDHVIADIPPSHMLFRVVYDIKGIQQVPNKHNGVEFNRLGITHEDDGVVPYVRGIFDSRGRLMVVINGNTDLGDAWEWADHPDYPSHFSTYAIQLGINTVIYALTH